MTSDEFIMAALPYISAGFSVLQGLAGFASGRQNAANAEFEAKQAMVTARAEADRERRQKMAVASSSLAQTGAQGRTIEGSPMLNYLQLVQQAELAAQDRIYAGRLQKIAKLNEAEIYSNQAWGSLLGGAAGAAGSLAKTLTPSAAPAPAPSPTGGTIPSGPLPTFKYKPMPTLYESKLLKLHL